MDHDEPMDHDKPVDHDEPVDKHNEPMDEHNKIADEYCSSCTQRRPKALFDGCFTCRICRDKKRKSAKRKRDEGKTYQASREELALHLQTWQERFGELSLRARIDFYGPRCVEWEDRRPLVIEDYLAKLRLLTPEQEIELLQRHKLPREQELLKEWDERQVNIRENRSLIT